MDRYRKLTIATDFSDASADALSAGAALAERFGSEVELVHAVELPGYSWLLPTTPATVERHLTAQAKRRLEELRDQKLPSAQVAALWRLDGPAWTIAERLRETESNLCVVATQGRTGMARLLIGSVAEALVRHAPCDVLVVRSAAPLADAGRLLVATDLSPASEKAVTVAGELARVLDAEIHLVHVVQPAHELLGLAWADLVQDNQERIMEELSSVRARCLGERPRVVTELLVDASPAHAIGEYAAGHAIDLVVVATHGHGRAAHLLLGSVAERVTRHAPCSVLVVR